MEEDRKMGVKRSSWRINNMITCKLYIKHEDIAEKNSYMDSNMLKQIKSTTLF